MRRTEETFDELAGGELGRLIQATDWSQTPLGPRQGWPQSLKIALHILLSSRYAMWLGWGPDLRFFYNDAYRHMTLGVKHPWALGRPAREVWAEIWSDIGPRAEAVLRTGVATWDEGLLLFLMRSGFREETYHTFSYSPVPDDTGGVGGMLCVVTEDTERIIGQRRLTLLRELASDLASAKTEHDVTSLVAHRLATDTKDLPFTATYLFDPEGKHARLAAANGVEVGSPAAPSMIDLDEANAAWPVGEVLQGASVVTVDNLAARFGELPRGPWDTPARQAVLAAIAKQGQDRPAGVLVAGLNPFRPFDPSYRGFIELLTGQLAAGIANARAYEEERKRAEALAELDRAKTTFFSNVSHEFRTPLTLMIGPVEDMLTSETEPLSAENRERLALIQRNGQRLLKLVNNLLDFSRIEAGRVQANFQPTDLAAFTSELASVFRSAVERAGMRLIIECAPVGEPVYVDRDMWEKIVLNLVSNAFKYTLEGEIVVGLRAVDGAVALSVRDTGIGIPEAELSKVFQRFHRIEGAQGRTHEGTGIGLALVQELVKLHGGSVKVESTAGKGSTFLVTIPRGRAHLPPDRIDRARTLSSTAIAANAFVEEALRWLPDDGPESGLGAVVDAVEQPGRTSDGDRPRVLLADDNADMREYVRRLLSDRYEVIAVADGQAAIETARDQRPDLVLTDVMMPRLDGFGLLRELRTDPATATIPVIMLSARAGEEARVEGLDAGADDYLIKPFSARELLARVGGTLALAQARREALRREEELRAETANVLESITEGFFALDREYRITYLNAEAERLGGIPRGKLLGKIYWEAYPHTLATHVERALRRAMVERALVRFENYSEPLQRWFEVNAYPARDGGLAIYFREITERMRQTERLQALAETAVAVNAMLSIDDTLQVLTDRARTIVGAHQAITIFVANQSWARAIESRSFSDKYEAWRALRPQPRATWLYRLACETNRPVRMTQEQLDARGGMEPLMTETPPLRGWLAAPLVGRDGRNLGLVYLSDKYQGDFTASDEAILVQLAQTASVAIENVQLYKVTQEARADAESASRMKDQFLATLSHELRTPLNAILGWARILQSGRVDAPTTKEGLEVIERNSRVQAQLIEDLLDISRIISGKLRLEVQRINLIDVIEASVAAIRPAADAKDIRILSVLDPLAGSVSGDPARLQQVVWNLLSNAVKFTPKGGRIQILLERVNSHVEISITDTGIGIKPEFLPYVFDRFRQADASTTTRRHGGLGLGLSIVKQLVEMHGGTVRAKSPGDGYGSTFTVAMPIAALQDSPNASPVPPKPPSLEEMRARTAPLDGIKVLVVDDEADARELIKRILLGCQAEVWTAGSMPEVLALLKDLEPDVLLSDIGMPDHDGYELIRELRGRGWTAKKLPAAALTAFARSEDRRRALLAGFQIHVSKPVEPEELVAVVATLVGRTGN